MRDLAVLEAMACNEAMNVVSVRPRAAGLLIGIECSRVRDSSRIYLTSLISTRIGVELAAVQGNYPRPGCSGLQLYSARTFHVTLSPQNI